VAETAMHWAARIEQNNNPLNISTPPGGDGFWDLNRIGPIRGGKYISGKIFRRRNGWEAKSIETKPDTHKCGRRPPHPAL